MKRILMIAVAAAMIGGCMTAQMKSTPFYEGHDVTYTGKAEDRVNLWPLAYWREPVGSVAWPLVSWGDDHFALRPVYSRYGKERNFLWPIGQHDSATGDGRAFPVFWGKDRFNVFPLVWNNNKFHSLFPLFFWREDDYMTLFPLAWWDIDGERFTLFPLYGHSKEADWLFSLYYCDDDVTLITPLFGKNSRGGSWLLPLYWHDEDATWVTPLFGMNKHGDSWLIPFYASVSGDFVSPLWCGGGSSSDENSWWCVPPLLSWGSTIKGVTDSRYLLGLAGSESGATRSRSWLLPFYYGDSDGTLVTPIYGRTKDAQWTFPVWYRDSESFASWFWGGHWNDKDELDWWIAPPLFTSGGRDKNGARLNILIALAGARWDGPAGLRSSWCFPFWYEDSNNTLVTPLYGHWNDCRWLAPLFYKDKLDLVTPLWWQSFHYKTGETASWMIPPLLSSYESWTNGKSETRLLLGIYGHDTATNGTAEADWLFPLYSWQSGSSGKILFGLAGWEKDGTNWVFPLYGYDGDAGDFTTALFGRATHAGHTDWWWLTPLAGHTTGNESGFWLWPLVSWSRGDDFASLEKMMNAETLAPSIRGEMKSERHWDCKTAKPVTNDVFRTEGASAASKLRFGSGLFGTTRNISQGGGDNDYISDWRWSAAKRAAGDEWRTGKERTVTFTDKTTFGNSITFGGEKTRVVNFDYDTKEKVFDGELDESCSLFGLLWSSRNERIAGGHNYKKRALLWRFWHWEELNGDVSLDVFPGFTYDSKTNGYSKTSFLWRFFRWENDSEKGKKADLLFIPVWR